MLVYIINLITFSGTSHLSKEAIPSVNKYFVFPLKCEQLFCIRCHPANTEVCERSFDFSRWNNTGIKVLADELPSVIVKNPQGEKNPNFDFNKTC